MEIKRRNLSGINFPFKFEGEKEEKPTSIEETSIEFQTNWIKNMDNFTKDSIILILLTTIKNIGNKLNIEVKEKEINWENETILNKINKSEENE